MRDPLIIADAPAKTMILNMQNHNSKHGCHTCEITTKKKIRQPEKTRRRAYKFLFWWIDYMNKEKNAHMWQTYWNITHNISKNIKR